MYHEYWQCQGHHLVRSYTNDQQVLKYSILWVFLLASYLEKGDLLSTFFVLYPFKASAVTTALQQNNLSQLFDFSQRGY